MYCSMPTLYWLPTSTVSAAFCTLHSTISDHLADDLAPVSPAPSETLIVDCAELVEMIFAEPIRRRGLRSTRPADAARRSTTSRVCMLRCARCRSHVPVASRWKRVVSYAATPATVPELCVRVRIYAAAVIIAKLPPRDLFAGEGIGSTR